MDEQGDSRISQEMVCFPRRWVGGHYDRWMRVERSRREIGIRHERDVGGEVITCCQMKLFDQKKILLLDLRPFFSYLSSSFSLYSGAGLTNREFFRHDTTSDGRVVAT